MRTLYDLRRAYDEFPEQVEAWCSAGPKITRDTIKQLLQIQRTVRDQVTAGGTGAPLRQEPTVPEFRHDEKNDQLKGTATQQLRQEATEQGFRHDEEKTLSVPSNEFPQETKKSPKAKQPLLRESSSREHEPGGIVLALYRGLPAQVVPNTTVKILVEGHSGLLEVPLSELVFAAPRGSGPM